MLKDFYLFARCNDRPWLDNATTRAAALYLTNPNEEIAGIIVSMTHEHAIDALEANPVLI